MCLCYLPPVVAPTLTLHTSYPPSDFFSSVSLSRTLPRLFLPSPSSSSRSFSSVIMVLPALALWTLALASSSSTSLLVQAYPNGQLILVARVSGGRRGATMSVYELEGLC